MFVRQWQVPTWVRENPEAKPYLTVDADQVYVSDPTTHRVLAFTHAGEFHWAVTGGAAGTLTYPTGVAVAEGVLYVSDPHVTQVVGFQVP